ncbi:MAG: hypothetical protein JRH16_06665 [Deltaproteobacteria bacterium]|nr:hypothetical protein [Deltaproteobacteria bacterium]MBW2360452.1 hypothetical protein [Deltaproteobacteria bacterium]
MRRETLTLLSILGLLLAPARAQADGPEAGFWWSPSLRLTSVIDDNVYSTKKNTSGDIGFWTAPRVELGYRTAALEVGADVGVDVRQYIDENKEASDELVRAVGWAEVGLARGFRVRVSNAYVPQGVVLGMPEDDTLNTLQTNRADAALNWSHALASGRSLSAGLVGTHFLSESYSEAVPAGGGFVIDPSFHGDFLQGLVFAQVDSPIAERTRLWARTEASYRDLSEFSSADHANLFFSFGVESERWLGVELEAAVGGGTLFFDALGTSYRVEGRVRALRRFDNGLSVWLGGRYLHTPDLTGHEIDESRGELGFEQRFGSATALRVRGFLTHYDAPMMGGGSNLFGGGELSLRRQLTRRSQIAVVYRHWSNTGSFAADDFSQNRVGLELGFRL